MHKRREYFRPETPVLVSRGHQRYFRQECYVGRRPFFSRALSYTDLYHRGKLSLHVNEDIARVESVMKGTMLRSDTTPVD